MTNSCCGLIWLIALSVIGSASIFHSLVRELRNIFSWVGFRLRISDKNGKVNITKQQESLGVMISEAEYFVEVQFLQKSIAYIIYIWCVLMLGSN